MALFSNCDLISRDAILYLTIYICHAFNLSETRMSSDCYGGFHIESLGLGHDACSLSRSV